MENTAIVAILICAISAAFAQLPVPYFERPDMITTNTRCIALISLPFVSPASSQVTFYDCVKVKIGKMILKPNYYNLKIIWERFRTNHFQHVQGQQLFERTLMAKTQLPNVHLGTMLEIDAKDAVKFMPFTMEDKKLKRLVSPAKMEAVFAA
ncbi:unnamed protein product [Brugia pahangi]|uniref:Secreted protein n=1 Tax=Brugia pahangi TaxID=6280 RepID=A0A0N4TUL2_BRUPA|nr:unnamed protein product [Brugia pahangi]